MPQQRGNAKAISRAVALRSAETPQHIVDQPRNIVVVVIVGQAAAKGNGAHREHGPAVGGLKIHHIGTDELCRWLSGPGGEQTELFLVHENKIFRLVPL